MLRRIGLAAAVTFKVKTYGGNKMNSSKKYKADRSKELVLVNTMQLCESMGEEVHAK